MLPSLDRDAHRNQRHIALEHAGIEALTLLPFLYLTYLGMELLERYAGERAQRAISRSGKAGPALGALLGVVPQCGFSAAGSGLYAGRIITTGTLLAIFLSTSDEMLPLLISLTAPPISLFTYSAILLSSSSVTAVLAEKLRRFSLPTVAEALITLLAPPYSSSLSIAITTCKDFIVILKPLSLKKRCKLGANLTSNMLSARINTTFLPPSPKNAVADE
jgi:hypothetical protein